MGLSSVTCYLVVFLIPCQYFRSQEAPAFASCSLKFPCHSSTYAGFWGSSLGNPVIMLHRLYVFIKGECSQKHWTQLSLYGHLGPSESLAAHVNVQEIKCSCSILPTKPPPLLFPSEVVQLWAQSCGCRRAGGVSTLHPIRGIAKRFHPAGWRASLISELHAKCTSLQVLFWLLSNIIYFFLNLSFVCWCVTHKMQNSSQATP